MFKLSMLAACLCSMYYYYFEPNTLHLIVLAVGRLCAVEFCCAVEHLSHVNTHYDAITNKL